MISTSIIIPSFKERYLEKTIEDIRKKAQGEIEIIVIKDKPMRTAINEGVEQARGKYILKTDAHCMFDEGFDVKLVAEHQPNWVQTPRRKRLDAENWKLIETTSPDVDYMFIHKDLKGYKDHKKNNNEELKKKEIDDTGTFQGSCYFMEKEYFKKLGLLDDKNFAGMGHESNEIVFKVLRDGGRVIVNKKTWYAHYHKKKEDINFRAKKDKSREYIKVLAREVEFK